MNQTLSNSECIPDNNLKDKGDGWGEEGSALMCLSPKPFLFMQCLQIFLQVEGLQFVISTLQN